MKTLKTPSRLSQTLPVLGLLAMCGAFVKLTFAIAAYTPQSQPTGYVGREVVTNNTLTSGNETLFRSDFEKQYWSGNLFAYPIDAAGVINEAAERWSGGAAAHIDAQGSAGRYIGTMKDTGAAIPFNVASLSTAQLATLSTTVNATAYNSTQIVNFLRGDHSLEGASALRQRFALSGSTTVPTVLGDIVHSKTLYLSDASNPTVFVGANDGMLHAINASTGDERWAYVPSMLIPKMKALAANPYTHDYYVDGQISVGNISLSGVSTRILVGGLGAGGKGLYALNINGSAGLAATSDQNAASKVMWEIKPGAVNYATPQVYPGTATAAAYDNLGYTYGTPQLKKINYGGTPLNVVILGNGYNNGGDYKGYLFVIDAATGKLVRAIAAGTSGNATNPNGIFETLPVDTDGDGNVDIAYAGDLNGTMWKFDLSSSTPTAWTAAVLHTTSPAQPITATPAAIVHPSGSGYVVNFATGGIFTGTQPPAAGTGATGDLADTSTFYVYGIWDGAPVGNTTLSQPVLSERNFTSAGNTTRVRRVTAAPPSWAPGGDKGWRVALPIGGERVVGEGSFISSGRYYFSTYNPTLSYLMPNTSTYVWGENWQMALDATTGGSTEVFMDLDGSGVIDNNDRIRYIATDAEVVANTQTVDTPILSPNVDGIAVGKWVSYGVQAQPTLVKLSNLFTTLFNINPDVTVPSSTPVGAGVSGGHFDVDIYFGAVTASNSATATISVASTGNNLPATLGGIEIDGVAVVPALTVSDITDGTATSSNAATIKNKFSSTAGYTATVSGSTVTITAPAGASYNGKTLTVLPGTSSGTPGTAARRPTGLIIFAGGTTSSGTKASINKTLSGNSASIMVGTNKASTSQIKTSKGNTPSGFANDVARAITTGGTIKAYVGGDPITTLCAAQTSSVVCLVDTSTYNNGLPVTLGTQSNFGSVTVTTVATAGGQTATPGTGWSDLAPALSTAAFSGGSDGGSQGDTCVSNCTKKTHVHQWDDKYDVTGVNMLNASNASMNLDLAIPSTSQNFKVIMHNQYMNPAVKLHIGDASYLPNVDFGYVSVKNYTTAATLDLATLPTYNRNPSSAGDGLNGPKYIASLAFNMPIDALTAKNWWGNGDVRVGLIPVTPGCVNKAAGSTDGNMYQPVIAPANDATLGYPLDGPGTAGYSNTTTPATATGLRHGGALTIQIIRDTTPNSALELNDSRGRPEYGWRVKSAQYSEYVLAEYNTYWHHPNKLCFGDSGWTKTPGADNGTSNPSPVAAGSTDPKIGNLQGNGSAVSSVTTVGNVTTIVYADGSRTVVQNISNPDGTVTTVTTNFPAGVGGTVTSVRNNDGTITSTLTKPDGTTVSGTAAAGGTTVLGTGVTVENKTIANLRGSSGTGSLLSQSSLGYKRISWKELIQP